MKPHLRIYHWLPRGLCMAAIAFVSIFALDAFEPGLTVWQQLAAFGMHLIPSFTLLAILIIAWNWELTGGILFILIGVGLTPYIFIKNYNMNHSIWMSLGIIMTITVPFIVVGILFLASNGAKKKDKLSEPTT